MVSSTARREILAPWLTTVTAAEFAGFLVPAYVGAITADARPAVQIPAVLAAGTCEGLVLGWGQARVLRRVLPGLPVRHWMIATAVGAVATFDDTADRSEVQPTIIRNNLAGLIKHREFSGEKTLCH